MFCQKCGSQLQENSMFCANCGASATPIPQNADTTSCGHQYSNNSYNHNHQNNVVHTGPIPGKGKAVASLVLGICAIVLPIPFLDVILAIIGLFMAASAKKEGFSGGLQTAGFVCSLVGLILSILFTAAVVCSFVFATTVPTFHWW